MGSALIYARSARGRRWGLGRPAHPPGSRPDPCL